MLRGGAARRKATASTSWSASSRRTAAPRPRRCSQGLEVLPRRAVRLSRPRRSTEFDLDARPGAQAARCCWSTSSRTQRARQPPSQALPGRRGAARRRASTSRPRSTSSTSRASTTSSRGSPACGCARPCRTACSSAPTRSSSIDLHARRADQAAARRARSTCPHRPSARWSNFFQPGQSHRAARAGAAPHGRARRRRRWSTTCAQHAIAGPWPAGERILVCVIGAIPIPMRLVRAGAAPGRPARRALDGASMSRLPGYDAAERRGARPHRRRAAPGGESRRRARTSPARDLVAELRALRAQPQRHPDRARQGAPTRAGANCCRARWSTSCCARTTASASMSFRSAAGEDERERRPPFACLRRAPAGWLGPMPPALGAGRDGRPVRPRDRHVVGIEPAATVDRVPRRGAVQRRDAAGCCRRSSPRCSSVLVYNFFFTAAALQLHHHATPQNVLALVVFLDRRHAATSNLAARMREQARDARRRLQDHRGALRFQPQARGDRALDDLLWAVVHQVASMLGAKVVLLMPEDEPARDPAGYPPEDGSTPASWAAANWAWSKASPRAAAPTRCPNADRLFLPMRTGRGGRRRARRAVRAGQAGPARSRSSAALLEALIDQAAVAIERTRLDREIEESRVLAETREAAHGAAVLDLPRSAHAAGVDPRRGDEPCAATAQSIAERPRARTCCDASRRGRAAEPLRRQPARHDPAGVRRAAPEARLGRSARAGRLGGRARRASSSALGDRASRCPADLPLLRARLRADASRCCSTSSTTPPSTRRRTRRSRSTARRETAACGGRRSATRAAAFQPADLERVFDKFYRVRAARPAGRRHRARPVDLPRHRRGAWRHDPRREPGGAGRRHAHRAAPAGRERSRRHRRAVSRA